MGINDMLNKTHPSSLIIHPPNKYNHLKRLRRRKVHKISIETMGALYTEISEGPHQPVDQCSIYGVLYSIR